MERGVNTRLLLHVLVVVLTISLALQVNVSPEIVSMTTHTAMNLDMVQMPRALLRVLV
jgi:hypothetical protein